MTIVSFANEIIHFRKSFRVIAKLATRLREAGMLVLGIGEKKTPNRFIVVCDKFIYIEKPKQGKSR